MITQNNLSKNIATRNVKRAAKINYLLKINGLSQKTIAEELGISNVWVCKYINGKVNSPTIEEWLKENLGVSYE